jgi:hypothetical protein
MGEFYLLVHEIWVFIKISGLLYIVYELCVIGNSFLSSFPIRKA